MTYDHELTLIDEGRYEKDHRGFAIAKEVETTVLCGLKSVGRAEFYKAAAAGLSPEAVFVVHAFEYSGEKHLLFEGARYSVIRAYETDSEEVELTCKAVSDGR